MGLAKEGCPLLSRTDSPPGLEALERDTKRFECNVLFFQWMLSSA